MTSVLLQALNEEVATSGMEALTKITSKIGFRLLIDVAAVFVLIRLIYYPIYKHRDLFFTFFIIHTLNNTWF